MNAFSGTNLELFGASNAERDNSKLNYNQLRTKCIIENALIWLKCDLSPVLVMEFVEFLRRPDIDQSIETAVDKNQGYGSIPPYKQAKQEIAIKYFSSDIILISQLIELDEKVYELQKNRDFLSMVENQMKILTENIQGDSLNSSNTPRDIRITTRQGVSSLIETSQNQSISHVNSLQDTIAEQNQYIEQMEHIHFPSLDENDKSTYLMMSAECIEQIRPRTDLIAFWKGRTGN